LFNNHCLKYQDIRTYIMRKISYHLFWLSLPAYLTICSSFKLTQQTIVQSWEKMANKGLLDDIFDLLPMYSRYVISKEFTDVVFNISSPRKCVRCALNRFCINFDIQNMYLICGAYCIPILKLVWRPSIIYIFRLYIGTDWKSNVFLSRAYWETNYF
jgi:hypothetical protein